MRRFLDNLGLLFLLGLLIFAISYVVWGWLEWGAVKDMPAEVKARILGTNQTK